MEQKPPKTMKKITLTLLFAIGFCSINFAQCNDGTITGYFTVILGQPTTFTATPSAQCDSCYDWDVNNHCASSDNETVGTLKIIGSDIGKTLTIEPTAVGPFSIHLSYMDEKGYHTASYMGNVVNASQITSKESVVTIDNTKKSKK